MARIDVESETTGSVWKILVKVGQVVEEDDDLIILESMKMEIPVCAPCDGEVREILVSEGGAVNDGNVVVVMEES